MMRGGLSVRRHLGRADVWCTVAVPSTGSLGIAQLKALEHDWNYDSIVVHYSGHQFYPDMRSIQDFDIGHRHWDDFSYHYGIAKTGEIYEGRELIHKGSHIKLQNTGPRSAASASEISTAACIIYLKVILTVPTRFPRQCWIRWPGSARH